MVASVAAGRPGTGRWLLALAPVATAVALIVGFWMVAGGAAGSRSATNPAVAVPRLLTVADAGPGWTSTHSGAIAAEAPGCFHPRSAMLASSPASLVGVVLSGPGGLPQVDEMAARYSTTGAAASAFDSVESALQCSAYTTPAGTATVVALPVAMGGYRSAGAQVAVGPGGADVVAAQRGTGLVLIVYGTAGVPDSAAVNRLTARALERLGP